MDVGRLGGGASIGNPTTPATASLFAVRPIGELTVIRNNGSVDSEGKWDRVADRMFVCICNAITDRQVGEALNGGVGCARDIYAFHGCRPQCGRCVPQMRALFSEQCRHCAAAPAQPAVAINPAFT